MNDRSVRHDTVRVSRTYDAPVERVYRAWAESDELERWYVPGNETWKARMEQVDFRVGGGKHMTFGPPDETYSEDCHYVDIVPNERICYAMSIARGDTRITVSMVTVELWPQRDGCGVRVTDQAAFLDGGDTAKEREQGWGECLDKLAGALSSATQTQHA